MCDKWLRKKPQTAASPSAPKNHLQRMKKSVIMRKKPQALFACNATGRKGGKHRCNNEF